MCWYSISLINPKVFGEKRIFHARGAVANFYSGPEAYFGCNLYIKQIITEGHFILLLLQEISRVKMLF